MSEITAEAGLASGRVDLKRLEGVLKMPFEAGGPVGEEGGGGKAGGGAGDSLRVRLMGNVDLATSESALKVEMSGEQLTIPATAPGVVPAEWAQAWKSYGVQGKVDLAASAAIHINPADGASTQTALAAGEHPTTASAPGGTGGTRVVIDTYDALLGVKGLSLKDPDWPEGLEELSGNVRIRPGIIKMEEMHGKMGVLDLAWNGQVSPESGRVELSGDAFAHGLPTKWLTWLPEGLARNIDRKDSEKVQLGLHMRQMLREGDQKPWTFDATLETRDLGVVPLGVRAGKANLVAHGTYQPAAKDPVTGKGPVDVHGDVNLQGVMAAENMVVSDHVVNTLTANVDVVSADDAIHFSEIKGTVAAGNIAGRLDIYSSAMPVGGVSEPGSGGEGAATEQGGQVAGTRTAPGTAPAAKGGEGGYLAEFSLQDADLARLVLPPTSTEEDRKKMGTGRVSATLQLLETFGKEGERTGRGELKIRDANIYNVPLAMGLMQVWTFRLPVARSFQQADMAYSIRGDEVDFDRILLTSRGINLAGTGSVQLSSKAMDLSFVTETPDELYIPIISPIIRETRNELLQLSVSGTLDNPKVTPVPLSAIGNTLRALLPRTKAESR
jgi:hypothetical protein